MAGGWPFGLPRRVMAHGNSDPPTYRGQILGFHGVLFFFANPIVNLLACVGPCGFGPPFFPKGCHPNWKGAFVECCIQRNEKTFTFRMWLGRFLGSEQSGYGRNLPGICLASKSIPPGISGYFERNWYPRNLPFWIYGILLF